MRIVSVKQAAEEKGVHMRTILRAIDSGELNAEKLGGFMFMITDDAVYKAYTKKPPNRPRREDAPRCERCNRPLRKLMKVVDGKDKVVWQCRRCRTEVTFE